MIRGLTSLLRAATERRLHDVMLCIVAAMAAAVFAAVSLGFGTFAAYVYLRASEGRVVAALILGAAYGLLAILVWAIWLARRRAGRSRRAAAASAENVDALLQALAAAGVPQDLLALVAAMRLGGALSPMQLAALALVGGFLAGRKLGK